MANLRSKLFFSGRDYKIGTIELDLILGEEHNFSNEITEHTIENGSVISDHIKNNLENGSLTGLITNHSIKQFGLITGVTNRAKDAFDELKRLWKERSLISIITIMQRYDNVVIENVSMPRDEGTGEAIIINLSFRQVKIVKLKTVQIDTTIEAGRPVNNNSRQASAKRDIGRTTGTEQSTAVF
jgi:hypothetical protein